MCHLFWQIYPIKKLSHVPSNLGKCGCLASHSLIISRSLSRVAGFSFKSFCICLDISSLGCISSICKHKEFRNKEHHTVRRQTNVGEFSIKVLRCKIHRKYISFLILESVKWNYLQNINRTRSRLCIKSTWLVFGCTCYARNMHYRDCTTG